MAGENGNGSWQRTLLAISGAVLMLVAGWIATDLSTTKQELARDLAALTQRTATLEEANRNMRESLMRIESVLEDIRSDMRDRRR
jgi:hypothetical protein